MTLLAGGIPSAVPKGSPATHAQCKDDNAFGTPGVVICTELSLDHAGLPVSSAPTGPFLRFRSFSTGQTPCLALTCPVCPGTRVPSTAFSTHIPFTLAELGAVWKHRVIHCVNQEFPGSLHKRGQKDVQPASVS